MELYVNTCMYKLKKKKMLFDLEGEKNCFGMNTTEEKKKHCRFNHKRILFNVAKVFLGLVSDVVTAFKHLIRKGRTAIRKYVHRRQVREKSDRVLLCISIGYLILWIYNVTGRGLSRPRCSKDSNEINV